MKFSLEATGNREIRFFSESSEGNHTLPSNTPRRATMRRTALTDRNAESTDVASAFARIKAIREGASSQSAFLDSDFEASPTVPRRVASSLGTSADKENADAMSDSDEDSLAAPVRKKKSRLVRKSQLEVKDSDEDEASPEPLARPRPRARAVLIDDSESETEVDSSADDAGSDDLASMMSGLGVSSGASAATSNPVAPPKSVPFAPVIPAAPRAPPREAPAPARAATRAPAPAAPARAALGADQAPRGAEETLGTFHFSANPENPHPRAGGVVGGAWRHPRVPPPVPVPCA